MKKLLIVIVVLLVLVPGGLALAGLALGHGKITTHTVAEPVREIVVKSGSGDVDLIPAGASVQVRETRHYVFEQPTLEQDLTDGVLTLEPHCGGWYFNCSTDLRVTVPAGIEITVEADSGDVHADGIDVRNIHAHSDSGDVRLALGGRQALAWAHTDSGDVHVETANTRAVDAQTDSGDVNVAAQRAPRRVVARTDSGDVNVDVPAGEYAVDTATDSGDENIDGISRNDRAPRSIEAETDSGDVTLDGR